MENIRNWLNGNRDYQSGVQLYLAHGPHGLLKKLFTVEGFSEFKQQQLEKALGNLLLQSDLKETESLTALIDSKAKLILEKGNLPGIPQIKFVQPDGTDFPKTAGVLDLQKRKGWNNPMDATEQALFDQWKPVYAEMLDLQARLEDVARQGLKDAAKKEEAGRMALRIIDLDKQCDAFYSDRDHYIQHGKLPEAKSDLDISLDPAQWPLKLQNHQRYLREYKAKLEKTTDADKRLKIAQNIQHQEQLILEYKKRLKLD